MFKVNYLKNKKEIECSKYSGNKNCDGKLHSYAPIYYPEDPLVVKYKCRCDKCNKEVILDFDPDQ